MEGPQTVSHIMFVGKIYFYFQRKFRFSCFWLVERTRKVLFRSAAGVLATFSRSHAVAIKMTLTFKFCRSVLG